MSYQPPFMVTPRIIDLVGKISEAVGRLSVCAESDQALRLRRINRIRTIHGSLAIEGNTLSEEQITAILEGKHVIAPPREIQEVKNAIIAYDGLDEWNPEVESDLLEAHHVLMAGLIDQPGMYRNGGVGVMDKGKEVIHMAPPAARVAGLMGDLFHWVKISEHHPLITSSVFHYEFEFIHPFGDGNGRMGRLWQTLILKQWNALFSDMPVESMIYEHQEAYYLALQESTEKSNSAYFITFMLEMIANTISTTPQVAPQVTPQVRSLLDIINGEMSRAEIQHALGLRDRKSFRERYLQPALQAGVIEMIIPDKPNSRLQKYRLSDKGKH
ncbi:Fic family protein [Mariprofundus ferrooxydans]|nr:Fic family protein [Mariprofundus ferrooxydans]